ncbi:lipopolysaccharide assembly protein LapB [Arcobacter sp. F2176]|uniref:tetratricopeptide repeat protein n=1 Tax=unclassified Arcobacter TaxID=2593671 RepID=UPI00100A4D0D|nr:tetratricopeptide repeat protein [Arcobacter sp. F2176]RXJ79776.1 tetratricopeptide repeat protein [Arcobacter sp. F2176]
MQSAFEYRDPLFGILVLLLLIFVISFLTYTFGVYKEKLARKEYRKLLKRFELGKLKEEDYVHLYKTYNLPFDSILLLASTFLHKGDYTKAISVYLALLEHVKDRVKKEELLELLGSTYFKGGFLQRSREIFLKILKFSPRNNEALKYLLLINERLKEYDKAIDVLNSLEEIDVDTVRDRIYIETLIILNDPIISFDKKTEKLYSFFKLNKIIERMFLEYLLQFNKEFFWENIDKFDLTKIIDLLWYLDFNDIDFDKVDSNEVLKELYNAKGYLNNLEKSEDFSFQILMLIKRNNADINADLNFDFLCTTCKKTLPIYSTRCPHCHNTLTFKVKHSLIKGISEKNQSLQ